MLTVRQEPIINAALFADVRDRAVHIRVQNDVNRI